MRASEGAGKRYNNRMRPIRSSIVLFLLASVSLAAQEDILLITMDTTRADHLSCYGYGLETSPALDAFAKGAVRFTRAYTPVPYTLPAHATILTGWWPKDHGVRDNIIASLGPAAASVAELMRSRGYRTAAFVSSFVLDRRFGLDRGFDHYDDRMTTSVPGDPQANERRAPDTEARVLDYLAGSPRGGRTFLWVHFHDPHHPYAPHPSTPPRMGDYDGEIRLMDRSIGRVLEAWGAARNGMVVIAADHGEALGGHGEPYHGIFLYESCVRVPLLVRAEGRLAPGVDRRLTSLADIAATIVDFAGLDGPRMPGRSLFAQGPLHDRLYFESFVPADNFGWSPPFGILMDDFKYIHLPKPELYDLARDPGENRNLAGRERGKARALRNALESGYGTRYDPPLAFPDRETIRRLESLGYRGGGRAHPGRDPKDLVWVVGAMDRGKALGDAGAGAEAESLYREILAANPENSPARLRLSAMLKRAGRRAEARASLEEGLRIDRFNAYLVYDLGVMDFEEGRLDAAERRFKAVLLLAPEHFDSLLSLAWVGLQRGDGASAAGWLERAATLHPDDPEVSFGWGAVAALRSEWKGAVERFRVCLRVQPDHLDALNGLGQASFQLGRFEESAAAYERSLALRPDQPQVYLHLGAIHLNALRDPMKALGFFQAFLDRYPEDAEIPRVSEIVRDLRATLSSPSNPAGQEP